MADLPARPDLDQLHHQAKDLLRAARTGDPTALGVVKAVSDRLTLASAQLALARDYGFPSWPKLKTEVDRRRILNDRDIPALTALLASQPDLASSRMEHWCDHPRGATPLGYIAMLRFDSPRLGLSRHLPGTGTVARALVAAGAPVDGAPDDRETPLITAASYGDAEVARVLIEAGADIEARASNDSGGVPGGSALRHAAVFGMTDVVDVLVAAGARVDNIVDAAAAGNVKGWLRPERPLPDRIRALIMAADHQRLAVIDQLLAAGTPIDAEDRRYGRQALRLAASNGRVASVRHLLARGADPAAQDSDGRIALDWCRLHHARLGDSPAHAEIEAVLIPATGSSAERP